MRRLILLLAVVLFALLIVVALRYERPAKCQDASFEGTAGVDCRWSARVLGTRTSSSAAKWSQLCL